MVNVIAQLIGVFVMRKQGDQVSRLKTGAAMRQNGAPVTLQRDENAIGRQMGNDFLDGPADGAIMHIKYHLHKAGIPLHVQTGAGHLLLRILLTANSHVVGLNNATTTHHAQ